MRFYAYRAIDPGGRTVEATLQAPSVDAARRLLLAGGYRVVGLHELPAGEARPVARPATSPPKPRTSPVVAQPVVATAPTVFRERDAGDKASFFLFEQLGRLLRSGIAANRALEQLSGQSRKPWLGERVRWASGAVAKGMSLADALDACRCFPTGAVGTIRAGEASGAVPDACTQAAMGCEQAHKLGTRCAAMTIMFFVVALYFPVGLAMVHGSVASMEAQADANSTLPITATYAAKVREEFGRILPVAIPFWIVLFGGWRLWLTPRMRRARHRAVLLTPVLWGRAREESLARASWALTELARAGISPSRSMALAADACPNLVYAERFREGAGRMREADKLSTAMRATGLLDPQMIDIVENGELAGDVPGAVASVHRATATEFERKNTTASTKIWFVLYPILGIIVGIIVATFAKTIFLGEMHAMFKDT